MVLSGQGVLQTEQDCNTEHMVGQTSTQPIEIYLQ